MEKSIGRFSRHRTSTATLLFGGEDSVSWPSPGDTAIGSTGNAEHGIAHLAVTPHKRLIQQRAFEFNPLVIIGESLLQLSIMGLPLTNQEVEVVETGDCTLWLIHPEAPILVRLCGQLSRRCQTQT